MLPKYLHSEATMHIKLKAVFGILCLTLVMLFIFHFRTLCSCVTYMSTSFTSCDNNHNDMILVLNTARFLQQLSQVACTWKRSKCKLNVTTLSLDNTSDLEGGKKIAGSYHNSGGRSRLLGDRLGKE